MSLMSQIINMSFQNDWVKDEEVWQYKQTHGEILDKIEAENSRLKEQNSALKVIV